MLLARRFTCLLASCCVFSPIHEAAYASEALVLRLKTDQHVYVQREPLTFAVTLTNNSGRDLDLTRLDRDERAGLRNAVQGYSGPRTRLYVSGHQRGRFE
ncbi:MAG: hypothetical protein GTN72_14180 [Candidatus Latescibacteria bacterium]|nr:hypothetical protein [Candidatus Latescibacterota bacterium]